MKNIFYLICLNQEIMSKCIIYFIESSSKYRYRQTNQLNCTPKIICNVIQNNVGGSVL